MNEFNLLKDSDINDKYYFILIKGSYSHIHIHGLVYYKTK